MRSLLLKYCSHQNEQNHDPDARHDHHYVLIQIVNEINIWTNGNAVILRFESIDEKLDDNGRER
jgi:hypothetical protein